MIRSLMRCLPLVAFPALAACGNGGVETVTKVFKGDGSIQCTSEGTSVEAMEAELTSAGIDVNCGQKSSDGFAYCAACGCETGRINVYTIFSEDAEGAESLGFAGMNELPDYQDEPCEQ